MGFRSLKRQIARARMTLMGVGNVNRKMSYKNASGVKNWKKALFGKTGKKAHDAQMADGRRRKQNEEARKSIAKRRIRKVAKA